LAPRRRKIPNTTLAVAGRRLLAAKLSDFTLVDRRDGIRKQLVASHRTSAKSPAPRLPY
jgi:hypothetical protein